jgi:KDO2-lipid IV(A) lauroyltransferase
MGKEKSPFGINFEYVLALVIIKVLEFLPLASAYQLSAAVARLVYVLDYKHRNRTVRHLLHAGLAANEHDARRLALANFINLGKTAVEICKVNQIITPANIREHIRFAASPETVDFFFNRDHPSPVIAITAHYGYWEFIGSAYSLLAGRPMLSVMRPFDNPKIGAYVNSKRQFGQHRICAKTNALKPLLGALRKGESIGFVADQHASESEGVETTFFGHPARTHTAPARLHLKTGVPLAVSVLRRLDHHFHFEMVIIGPLTVKPSGNQEEDLRKTVQLYTSALEEIIRAAPEQWLWAHRRWLDINRKKRTKPPIK